VRRAYLLGLIAVALVLFLVVSALLARAFSVDSAERSAITGLVQAEARGDASAVVSRITGCTGNAACRARAAAATRALEHPGTVSIIQIQSSAGFSLGGTVGTARVAWTVASSLPIVQCVRVRRAGNVISGLSVHLLALTRRIIPSDRACPARF
jgi:hypothetical protein